MLSAANTAVFVQTFIAVFVLADAVGNVPVVLILTKGMTPGERNHVIDKAVIVAIALLLLFTFVGNIILSYLEISMGALRVAGGLLLLLIALQMLRGELNRPILEQGQDIAITPLALPLLAGPGTLTVVMLLSSKSPFPHLGVVLGILAAMLITWLILRLANRINELISSEGEAIVSQLLGFLLAALAVEIGSAGIKEIFLR
ncbi:MAG TPA: MarC family protein [Nostocaceae cyanobacterium]|nr:MarC family protein [Nostocaceae cyanobacterium]